MGWMWNMLRRSLLARSVGTPCGGAALECAERDVGCDAGGRLRDRLRE